MQMARQYCPSARIYISDKIYLYKAYPLSTSHGAFRIVNGSGGPAHMESSCESTECAAAENQQRTVHQIREAGRAVNSSQYDVSIH